MSKKLFYLTAFVILLAHLPANLTNAATPPSVPNWTLQVVSWPLEKAYPGIEYNIRLGVIGGSGPLSGHVLYTGNSPQCNNIRKFNANYSANVLYKSLVNLDPNVPNFQPWPVVRLDATNDGAFSWSNDSMDYYDVQEYGFIPIRISSMWCTDDNVPSFKFIPVDDLPVFKQ